MGVRYKARDAPTLEVLFGLLQMHSAFHMKCTSVIQPATGTPYPQVSQVPGTDLPVQKTKITAFSGDYHRPAAPPRHAAVQVDPQVVI